MIDISTIPDRYIGWNKLGFHDLREEAAVRLATALHEAGLDHLIDPKRWIREMPDRLCAGCIFGEEAWQAKLARDATRERESRRLRSRPPRTARKLNGRTPPA